MEQTLVPWCRGIVERFFGLTSHLYRLTDLGCESGLGLRSRSSSGSRSGSRSRSRLRLGSGLSSGSGDQKIAQKVF